MRDIFRARKRAKLLARKQALYSGPFFSLLTKRNKRLLQTYSIASVA